MKLDSPTTGRSVSSGSAYSIRTPSSTTHGRRRASTSSVVNIRTSSVSGQSGGSGLSARPVNVHGHTRTSFPTPLSGARRCPSGPSSPHDVDFAFPRPPSRSRPQRRVLSVSNLAPQLSLHATSAGPFPPHLDDLPLPESPTTTVFDPSLSHTQCTTQHHPVSPDTLSPASSPLSPVVATPTIHIPEDSRAVLPSLDRVPFDPGDTAPLKIVRSAGINTTAVHSASDDNRHCAERSMHREKLHPPAGIWPGEREGLQVIITSLNSTPILMASWRFPKPVCQCRADPPALSWT